MSSKYFIGNTCFRHHVRINLCHRGDRSTESLELVSTSYDSSILVAREISSVYYLVEYLYFEKEEKI